MVLFADESLKPEDCRVEWADGGVERDVGRLWREVEQAVARFASTDETEQGPDAADKSAGNAASDDDAKADTAPRQSRDSAQEIPDSDRPDAAGQA